MNLQITYVDDQTPNSYRTYANYKKIVVTVLRKSDSKQLTKEVTYLSAAAKNAATESVITALVMDYGTGGAARGRDGQPRHRAVRAAHRHHRRGREGDLPGADGEPAERRPGRTTTST